MKKVITIIGTLIVLALIGFFGPLAVYTTSNGCDLANTPTKRLHIIKGDSIQKIKDMKDPKEVDCAYNVKYVLYLF